MLIILKRHVTKQYGQYNLKFVLSVYVEKKAEKHMKMVAVEVAGLWAIFIFFVFFYPPSRIMLLPLYSGKTCYFLTRYFFPEGICVPREFLMITHQIKSLAQDLCSNKSEPFHLLGVLASHVGMDLVYVCPLERQSCSSACSNFPFQTLVPTAHRARSACMQGGGPNILSFEQPDHLSEAILTLCK